MSSERAIRIVAGSVRLYAILDSSQAATLIFEALPLEGKARIVGQEVHLDVQVAGVPEPQGEALAHAGDLAFDPQGPTIALCFASGEPPAGGRDSRLLRHIFGRITGDASRLGRVADGDRLKLTALGD